MFLAARQAIHAVPHQDAVHGGDRQRLVMKALQVVGDFARAEMVGLAEVLLTTSRGVARGDRAGVLGRSARPAAPSASYRRFHR